MSVVDQIKQILICNKVNGWSYKHERVDKDKDETTTILKSKLYEDQCIQLVGGKGKNVFRQFLDINDILDMPSLGFYNWIQYDNYIKKIENQDRGKNYTYTPKVYYDSVTVFKTWLHDFNKISNSQLTLIPDYGLTDAPLSYTVKVAKKLDTLDYNNKLVENHARIFLGKYFPYNPALNNVAMDINDQLNKHGYVKDECGKCKMLEDYITSYNAVNKDKPMTYLEKNVVNAWYLKNDKICTAQIFADLFIF